MAVTKKMKNVLLRLISKSSVATVEDFEVLYRLISGRLREDSRVAAKWKRTS